MTTIVRDAVEEDVGPAENELPEGWTLAQVGGLLSLTNGFPFKPSQWKESGLPIIRIQNLNNPDAPFNYCREHIPEKYTVRNGDLLFAWSGTPGTSFGAHIWLGGDAWLNQHIFRVDFDSGLFNKQFLRLAINRNLEEYISQAQGGVGLAHITKRKFDASFLALPPRAEQKRIVAKARQLFHRVNAARGRLARVSIILKRFRQAVLAAGCSGRLTADWRESQDGSENGAALLETILEERRRNREHLRQRTRVSPKYVEPRISSIADLLDLPESWVWTSIEAILRHPDGLSYGILKPGVPDPTGVPMLRVMDIGDWDFNQTDIVRVSPKLATQYSRTRLEPGDILLAVMATVGRVAVVPDRFAGANVNRALAVLKISRRILPEFAVVILRSPFFQKTFTSEKLGSAQARINLTDLRGFPFPIPPEGEQREIVRRVEALFKLADAIEKRVAAATARAEKMTQAILAKAFRGELVPTEAELARREGRSYEPASALLARIRAERESSSGSSRSRATSSFKEPITRRTRKRK